MVERATLYKWLQLEEIKEKVFTAVEDRRNEDFLSHFYEYLSTAVEKEKDWSELPWIELRDLFYEIEEVNTPTKPFPILLYQSKQSIEWTYEGRTWYFWLHTLASEYGWAIEYVKELDVDDAIGLLQETLLEKQDERAFAWGLSEVAYEYNKQTGKSKLRPLEKPKWMRAGIKVKEPKKVKIRRDFLPVGAVVSWKKDNA